MSTQNESAPLVRASLGTLDKLPLEIRVKIYRYAVSDIQIKISDKGKETNASARQRFPAAIEQELNGMHVLLHASTFIFRTPIAFQTFLGRLSEPPKNLLRNLHLVLLAGLPDREIRYCWSADLGALMDAGWRACFRMLPPNVQNIMINMTSPTDCLDDNSHDVCHHLSRFSTMAYFKTKGRVRFRISGCKLLNEQQSFQDMTVNSLAGFGVPLSKDSRENPVNYSCPPRLGVNGLVGLSRKGPVRLMVDDRVGT
ncbi:MAG: hypothetical protein M1812_005113 [Candelaria pacifica]|nr:MAG: hypothetical protein M1812_005113 [Candelaria pacifica]